MADKSPIRMLHDRVLVQLDKEAGERRSTGGIVIPATAALGHRRLAWAKVVAVGPHARAVELGDRVLFDPDDKAEVEVSSESYILVRERDGCLGIEAIEDLLDPSRLLFAGHPLS